jgi:hypothetical protein
MFVRCGTQCSIGFSSFFLHVYCFNFLQIRMLLRLTPGHGGDGTVYGIIAINDTGSDMLTLFNTDLAELTFTLTHTMPP